MKRARKLIDERLPEGEVLPDTLAAALGVSRSTLYRLFEPHDGVAAFVLERRLGRARTALANTRDTRRISAIAQELGFSDQSNFSRAFKRRFGNTPAEFRNGASTGAQSPVAEAIDLRPWIERLY